MYCCDIAMGISYSMETKVYWDEILVKYYESRNTKPD